MTFIKKAAPYFLGAVLGGLGAGAAVQANANATLKSTTSALQAKIDTANKENTGLKAQLKPQPQKAMDADVLQAALSIQMKTVANTLRGVDPLLAVWGMNDGVVATNNQGVTCMSKLGSKNVDCKVAAAPMMVLP